MDITDPIREHKMMLAREQAAIDSIPKELLGSLQGHSNSLPNKPASRKTAIEQAVAVIYGDREKTYGDPGKNLRVIAEYWSTHLSATKGQNIHLTVPDVCVMMILLKQARLANTPNHEDSIVDTIGYAALLDRVLQHNTVAHLSVASAPPVVAVPVPVLTDKIDT